MANNQPSMREYYEEVRATLSKKTKSHLETFNDGVIAIYITIMALELPYPSANVSMSMFIHSILLFFISFFVVADFWYDIHQTFLTFTDADHGTVVTNFILLAFLALIPVTTKWIMYSISEQSVIFYGCLYLVISLLELFLFYVAHRKRFGEYMELFHRLFLIRMRFILLINIVLIILATRFPKQAMVFYLLLPIFSFFFPTVKFGKRRIKKRMQNKR